VNKRLIPVGVAVVLPVLVLAAALHGLALAQGPAPQGEVGVSFIYQGQLVQGGSPVSGTCAMAFRLYDDGAAGSQVGRPITLSDVAVTGGLFTVNLDFGNAVFDGQARWLAIRAACPAGSGGWTDHGRWPLAPVPYALALPGLRTQPNATSPNLVGGYSGNSVHPNVVGAAIGGGGRSNYPNQVTANFGVVGGGFNNLVRGQSAFIGGGLGNVATGTNAAVGGGYYNQAYGYGSVIGGGDSNWAVGDRSAIGGGGSNQTWTSLATIGGGKDNLAIGELSVIGGGMQNVTGGVWATVGGGEANQATSIAATVPGGRENEAAGEHSFAAGRRAKARQDGCFVWGDDTDADVACDTADAFVVRASGGVTLYTNSTLTSGVYLAPGGSSWNSVSARARKENFAPVDGARLLARLGEIDIATWNYKSQSPAIRHIGPMADDFNGLVAGLGGEGQGTINSLDADGVALAAIQALAAENAALRARLDSLEARLAALEAGPNPRPLP
jgi:hypothetical protein